MKSSQISNKKVTGINYMFSDTWISPLGERGAGLFLSFVFALLLASCGSKKHMTGSATGDIPGMGKGVSVADLVQTVNANRLTEPSISAKINLNLSTARKSTRVGGSLRMKRNDVIQISLVALGLMEVGRLELTPDYMMVMDRINHQYVKCSYSDVDFFSEAGINFYTFQSLFWEELFVLQGQGEAPSGNNFNLKKDTEEIQLVNAQNRNVAVTFVVNATNQLVRETQFSRAETTDPVLKWQYADWAKLGEQDFPGSMKISFALPNDNVEALFKISSVKPDADWETRTEINKNRYSEVSLQTAFNKIMSLAQ